MSPEPDQEQIAKALLAGLGFELGREGTRYVARDRREQLGLSGALQPVVSGSLGSLLALFEIDVRPVPRSPRGDEPEDLTPLPPALNWTDRNKTDD